VRALVLAIVTNHTGNEEPHAKINLALITTATSFTHGCNVAVYTGKRKDKVICDFAGAIGHLDER